MSARVARLAGCSPPGPRLSTLGTDVFNVPSYHIMHVSWHTHCMLNSRTDMCASAVRRHSCDHRYPKCTGYAGLCSPAAFPRRHATPGRSPRRCRVSPVAKSMKSSAASPFARILPAHARAPHQTCACTTSTTQHGSSDCAGLTARRRSKPAFSKSLAYLVPHTAHENLHCRRHALQAHTRPILAGQAHMLHSFLQKYYLTWLD